MARAGAIHAAHEPTRRSRHAMIFMGVKDTSSRPPDDWGGVPAMCDRPRSATAKRGYDVIPQITACNTPGSQRENQPGSRDEIRQKEALMSENKIKNQCMKVQIE